MERPKSTNDIHADVDDPPTKGNDSPEHPYLANNMKYR